MMPLLKELKRAVSANFLPRRTNSQRNLVSDSPDGKSYESVSTTNGTPHMPNGTLHKVNGSIHVKPNGPVNKLQRIVSKPKEPPTPTIEELAARITAATKVVSEYMSSNNLPPLSFSVDGLSEFPKDAPKEVQFARMQIQEATRTLTTLIQGPADHMRKLAVENNDVTALQYIYHFKVAEKVPLDGFISYVDLAAKTGLNEVQLRRILRLSMTNNVFREPQPGYVAHNASSALLVRDENLSAYIGHVTEVSFPVSAFLIDAVDKWGASEETNETAYNISQGTEMKMFEHMTKTSPQKVARFAKMMGAMTKDDGYGHHHAVKGFDWESLGDGTVVDIGGSTGLTAMELAKATTKVKFIVQDTQDVIANATVPRGFNGRIEYMAHDFFTPQPVIGADVYLLRMILHDYSDKYAAQVLENLIPALKDGSRIILVDGVMPDPGVVPKTVEKHLRTIDLVMMTHFNGLERELQDWRRLFRSVDSRLHLRNVTKPHGSTFSILEIVWDSDGKSSKTSHSIGRNANGSVK